MIFGIPVEIRDNEHRVGAVPFLVEELVKHGHQVLVETNAGVMSQYSDADYQRAGAMMVPSPEKLYGQSTIVLKVRAPRPVEYELIKPHHIIFSFFNFFGHLDMGRSLMARGCTCYAYEYLKTTDQARPLLDMDRRIAGQLAVQQGAHYLQTPHGGRGVLLGDAPGVSPARVVVLGATSAGIAAAAYASRCGATVSLLDENPAALEKARKILPDPVHTLTGDAQNIQKIFPTADLVISAIQEVEQKSPVVVSEAAVGWLPKGAVIIDLDIDNGGSVETSAPTKFENPVFVKDGIIHYCVPNLAGAVPATASEALSSTLLPFLIRFLDRGFKETLLADEEFRSGLVIFEGRVTNPTLAKELGVPYFDLKGSRE